MLNKPIDRVVYNEQGAACGVVSVGEDGKPAFARCKQIVGDPTYFRDRCVGPRDCWGVMKAAAGARQRPRWCAASRCSPTPSRQATRPPRRSFSHRTRSGGPTTCTCSACPGRTARRPTAST
mmetsp:Transcript_30676/g.82102  ORF Transcript_30676/g.82102 Transcript_30676/m.82102 type:complete len:122 (-) Transcript_30676:709-1074(-)